jgi:hypothetical protein
VGDWSQQWLNLRYVTRFLVRVGADEDAIALHRALVKAGKQSPLGVERAAIGDDPTVVLRGVETVARARAALNRYR